MEAAYETKVYQKQISNCNTVITGVADFWIFYDLSYHKIICYELF